MVFKGVVFCVVACLVQQSIAGPYCLPKPPCGCGSGRVSINKIEEIEEISYKPRYSSNCVSIEIPTNGGALAVTSIGPIAPSGIAIAADVALGGDLALSGVLPYLSAVAFEGQFGTSGASPVAYGCGDIVAINEQIGGNIGAGIAGSYAAPVTYGCGDRVAIKEQIGGIGAGPYGPSLHSYHGHHGCGCKY